MSTGVSRGIAFDRGCVAALLSVVSLRCIELVCLRNEAFSTVAGKLPELFFVTTSSNLAVFTLVPLIILLGVSATSLCSSPPVLIRAHSHHATLVICIKVIVVRAAAFSLATVVSGMAAVAAKGFWVFGAAGTVTFLALESLLLTLFNVSCQLIMLLGRLAGKSLLLGICLTVCYGSADYLASFSPLLDSPVFYIGWRLTLLTADLSVVAIAGNAARLASIVVALVLACAAAARRRELLPQEDDDDVR